LAICTRTAAMIQLRVMRKAGPPRRAADGKRRTPGCDLARRAKLWAI
jgi:hypothetical protein